MDDWINVEDRLPEELQEISLKVNCPGEGERIFKGIRYNTNIKTNPSIQNTLIGISIKSPWEGLYVKFTKNVTHWRPENG